MINNGRWLDLALFNPKEEYSINEYKIKAGLQQVKRKEYIYEFSMIGKEKYLEIPIALNEKVVSMVFSNKIMF